MVAVIDIGNTNIKFALYKNGKCFKIIRLSEKNVKKDFFAKTLKGVKGVCISSVVPKLTKKVLGGIKKVYLGEIVLVSPNLDLGIGFDEKVDESTVGQDRIADVVGAVKKYGAPIITVDFGTATVFNAVSSEGNFVGGAISPGFETALKSLCGETALLKQVELEMPETSLSTDTAGNLSVGFIMGYAGLVEKIATAMQKDLLEKEIGKNKKNKKIQKIKVVATGGNASKIAELTSAIDVVDEELTLDGIYEIYIKNHKQLVLEEAK